MGMLIRIESRDWQEKNLAYTAAWRVGMAMEVKPSMVKEVTEVEADGEELHFILTNYSNLPKLVRIGFPAEKVRWYGAHAQFIVGNLL